jgi:Rieske Fe-S protein
MNRRNFIKNSCVACLSFSAVGAMLSSCTTTKYTTGKLEKDGLTVSKDEFKVKQKGGTAYSSFIIIRNDALQFPICIFRISDQEYSALWMKCSHQGAELQAAGDVLQCPAHGSEFSNRGVASGGPANGNLRSFPVRVSANDLFIDLRKQA